MTEEPDYHRRRHALRMTDPEYRKGYEKGVREHCGGTVFDGRLERRLQVHPDVARKFIAVTIEDGALIPQPDELDGAFRIALLWAYDRLGGDVEHF